MFERFTERARQVVVNAQLETRRLRHGEIRPEHLLLGVLTVEDGLGARVLAQLGVTAEDVRAGLGEGDAPESGQMPFTLDAKRALEESLREAIALGHNYIGAEHVLLGIVRVEPGLVDPQAVRNGIIQELTEAGAGGSDAPLPRPMPPRPRRHEVHRLDGAPDTWPAQLDAFAREGWHVVSVVATDDGHHAVLARPR